MKAVEFPWEFHGDFYMGQGQSMEIGGDTMNAIIGKSTGKSVCFWIYGDFHGD